MPTACVDPTLGNGVNGEFGSIIDSSVQPCTSPYPPLMTLFTMQGCSMGGSYPCGLAYAAWRLERSQSDV